MPPPPQTVEDTILPKLFHNLTLWRAITYLIHQMLGESEISKSDEFLHLKSETRSFKLGCLRCKVLQDFGISDLRLTFDVVTLKFTRSM